MLAYRCSLIDVYRKSTAQGTPMTYFRNFRGISIVSESSHQQYLAKNQEGYCGIGGCGVKFDFAGLQPASKA